MKIHWGLVGSSGRWRQRLNHGNISFQRQMLCILNTVSRCVLRLKIQDKILSRDFEFHTSSHKQNPTANLQDGILFLSCSKCAKMIHLMKCNASKCLKKHRSYYNTHQWITCVFIVVYVFSTFIVLNT